MRRSESGAVLIFVLLVSGLLIGIAALAVDIGVALHVKQEAVKAAELSARRAVAEMYVPDYDDLALPPGDDAAIPGLDPDKWWSQFQEATARNAAGDLGSRHTAGWTTAFAPYSPDIQINDPNHAAGDILLGNWITSPGGPFSFALAPGTIGTNAGLARAARVGVQRITGPRIPGISEGANPIPVHFGGIFGVTEMQQRSAVTAKLDPAAVFGQGALVPLPGGGDTVTGALPLAFRHDGIVRRIRPTPAADLTVRDWIVGNDPAVLVTVRVTRDGLASSGQGVPYAGSTYWVSFPSPLGGTAFDRLLRRLNYMAQKPAPNGELEPPPLCPLGLPLLGPGQGDGGALSNGNVTSVFQQFFRTNKDDIFTNRTWTAPVVVNGGADDRRCAGFLRIYCEGARRISQGGSSYIEIDLRLAPSACNRNSGPLVSLRRLSPPSIPSATVLGVFNDMMWTTDAVDGLRSGPRPFGVACTVVTADY